MKKSLALLFIVLFVGFVVIGCNQEPKVKLEEYIVGTWEMCLEENEGYAGTLPTITFEPQEANGKGCYPSESSGSTYYGMYQPYEDNERVWMKSTTSDYKTGIGEPYFVYFDADSCLLTIGSRKYKKK